TTTCESRLGQPSGSDLSMSLMNFEAHDYIIVDGWGRPSLQWLLADDRRLKTDDYFLCTSSLNTFPSFMTNCTLPSSLMSRPGAPGTARTSREAPRAITPMWPLLSSVSAALEVALRIASIGLIPKSTMRGNSWAIG